MDVSFTNVLEGARQYFQGLPSVSCSTANNSYTTGTEHQANHYAVEQNQERTTSTSSYWPPHQDPQLRPPTRDRVSADSIQRPPSHQSETSRTPSHNQTVNSLQEQLRTPNNYHAQNQNAHQEQSVPTSHSYQFTRPHSREVQHAPPQQQQQYQSHILPNPSYHQSSTSQQTQARTPTRMQDQSVPSSMSSQSYHQMQQAQNHSQTQNQNQQHIPQPYAAYQQQQQQPRSYYSVHTQAQPQSQPYHHSYQVASSQSYSQPQEPSYVHQSYTPHSQNSFQNDNSYTTSKLPIQEVNHMKESQTSQNATSQSYRTTHNLPPIAALSSLNYHSSRSSREAMRIANKARAPTSIPASSYSAKPITEVASTSQHNSRAPLQYSMHNNHKDYANNTQQSRPTVSQTYQYTTAVTTQSQSHYTTTSGSLQTPISVPHQSSSNHSHFQTPPTYSHQDTTKTYQVSNSKVIQQTSAQVNQNVGSSANNGIASVMKQKRESPLDLSVKTVRTSADSTLDDVETNANDAQRLSKYYQTGRPSMHSPMQAPTSYPTYDVYANSFHRNLSAKQTQVTNSSATGAPKVDFFPNFNIPLSQTPSSNKLDNRRLPVQSNYDVNHRQTTSYDRKNIYQPVVTPQTSNSLPLRHPVNTVPTTAHVNSSNSMLQTSSKKHLQGLPRIDFLPSTHKPSTMYATPANDTQRKRTPEQIPAMIPNKIPKVDVWRQTIDQQIEQRLSSYAKSRLQHEQMQKQQHVPNKQLVNGNYAAMNQDRSKDLYSSAYHRSPYNTLQTPQTYTSTNHYNNVQTSHNQTYVPTASAHQYPGYANHGSQQQQSIYPQHSLTRTNSNPSLLASTNRNSVGGAADRRVLSLLRNSLEIKGAKEAQKKLEQEQYKPPEPPPHHPRPDVQQPSTDVMAPLQPKPGLVARNNMSPFAATSIFDRNTITPPPYKLHIPKAIDSIKFDGDMAKDNTLSDKINKQNESSTTTITNANTADLDGLAAFLAARIRTKAELKQVGPTQNVYNNNLMNSTNIIRSSSETQLSRPQTKPSTENLPQQHSASGGSPPKLTKERLAYLPRRRLFSRNEEDPNSIPTNNVPPRDKSGLRSSSETSVFDFPDSDSETEMPVLERQSLVDMRRDRKTLAKTEPETLPVPPSSPVDVSFDDACDKFMEQLKTGVGKKRGRRKKVVEPDVLAKLETVVTLDKPLEQEIKKESDDTVSIKEELSTVSEEKVKDIGSEEKVKDIGGTSDTKGVPKVESDSDSDVPLVKVKPKTGTVISDSEGCVETTKDKKSDNVAKPEASSDSDNNDEAAKDVSDKSKVKEEKTGNNKKETPPSKPLKGFGDGTDFHPGWEEEVYKYKRSLRMPASLIHVTRPPQWHRLSTSLPDLDPCPNSPSPSENTKIKTEPLDSDIDSNSNFSFSLSKNNYDSEEGSSSVKSVNTSSNIKPKGNNSILDRLLERCGARKRKRTKKKNEDIGPKIVPKSESQVALLPTPSLQIATDSNKKEQIIKGESVFLGFRKKTIDNFKDTFISSSNSLLGINEQFKTVVLKSRTRLETRALKQKATIKEVFGEDRPASAPPVTCVDNTVVQDSDELKSKPELNISFPNDETATIDKLKVNSVLENTKEVLKSKLLSRGRKGNSSLLKTISTKKYNDNDIIIKRDPDSKSATPSIDGDDCNIPTRKRMKNMRRKLSSGFDYIRKKKKQVKKEGIETEITTKPKRRGAVPKTVPESVQDIQKEIKMWVMNKGIGETHLHRAARLGYTDITAYCLEKMDSSPSPKDNAGYTPLHEACARGHLSIAKLLLLYGANVSESAQGGIRPLHEAAENGFVEIVRLLLSYGADPMLATYSGLTPLSLATDETTVNLLQSHIADIQEQSSAPWFFLGPAQFFDPEESGYNPLEDVPSPDQLSDEEDVEFESSDTALPNLYTIRGEPQTDQWILLQDLSNILKIKSRDALLRQISSVAPSTSSSSSNYKSVLRELKMADFLEQASCCQYMCAGEKINTRASKIALVKYSDKVRQLLGVEKEIVTAR